MNVVDSLADLIRGNPFDTKIGSLIYSATSESSGIEYDHYLIICNYINESKDGPKDAFRAIKRRLNNSLSTQHNTSINSLSLLDTCLDQCGYRFQMLLSERDSIADIVKYAFPNSQYTTSPQVKHKLLALIKKYGEKFQDNVDIQSFPSYYSELVQAGAYTSFNEDARYSPVLPQEDNSTISTQNNFNRGEALKQVLRKKMSKKRISIKNSIKNNRDTLFQKFERGNTRSQTIGEQQDTLSLNYQERISGISTSLKPTYMAPMSESFRSMALSKCELLMGLIETNKDKCLDQIDPETKGLMIELNENVIMMQRDLVNSIQGLQTENDFISTAETQNVNTDLDSKLMTMIGVNDELLQCSELYKKIFFSEEKLKKFSNDNDQTPIPGLMDSVTDLEEMQSWMDKMELPLKKDSTTIPNPPNMQPPPSLPMFGDMGETAGAPIQPHPILGGGTAALGPYPSLPLSNIPQIGFEGEMNAPALNPQPLSLESNVPELPSYNIISNMPPPMSQATPPHRTNVDLNILNEFDPFRNNP